jgi:Zn-finger in ubiquitin-hydrolases and other protein
VIKEMCSPPSAGYEKLKEQGHLYDARGNGGGRIRGINHHARSQLTGRAGRCAHLHYIRDISTEGNECKQCVELGDSWVHLRVCMTCGQIGCCDSSINKHAADEFGHPIVRSIQPGEDWMWCYVDETVV